MHICIGPASYPDQEQVIWYIVDLLEAVRIQWDLCIVGTSGIQLSVLYTELLGTDLVVVL